jgi:hypothetical protein
VTAPSMACQVIWVLDKFLGGNAHSISEITTCSVVDSAENEHPVYGVYRLFNMRCNSVTQDHQEAISNDLMVNQKHDSVRSISDV